MELLQHSDLYEVMSRKTRMLVVGNFVKESSRLNLMQVTKHENNLTSGRRSLPASQKLIRLAMLDRTIAEPGTV